MEINKIGVRVATRALCPFRCVTGYEDHLTYHITKFDFNAADNSCDSWLSFVLNYYFGHCCCWYAYAQILTSIRI